jgi:hypothetical protein
MTAPSCTATVEQIIARLNASDRSTIMWVGGQRGSYDLTGTEAEDWATVSGERGFQVLQVLDSPLGGWDTSEHQWQHAVLVEHSGEQFPAFVGRWIGDLTYTCRDCGQRALAPEGTDSLDLHMIGRYCDACAGDEDTDATCSLCDAECSGHR